MRLGAALLTLGVASAQVVTSPGHLPLLPIRSANALLALGIIAAQFVVIVLLVYDRSRKRRSRPPLVREPVSESAAEELSQAVLASIAAQIAIIDRNGRIIRVNAAWRELAERSMVVEEVDAFLNWNYLDECRRAEERGCVEAGEIRRGLEAVLDERASSFRHEYHWLSPDVRWFELRVDTLERGEGGAILTHLDISDRRLAELRLEETRSQVAHLGRVATIGELAAAVSHELKQPLASIRANAQAGALLLGKSPADIEQVINILNDIAGDSERAAEIIDQMRTLLRKAETVSAVDLNEVARQAIRLLQRDATLRHTQLELVADPELPKVPGDPVQLQQVIINLLLNALDAASTALEHRAVMVRTTVAESMVELTVSDTGPGLAPDVLEHLFEPFFSTKPHGLGLGLVIVRSIVDRHHGRIQAKNRASGGAIFRVDLPAIGVPVPSGLPGSAGAMRMA